LLFPTGYAANLGIINALVEQGDAVFCDRENHASLIDGSRICDGSLLVYRRSQLDRLQASLSKRRSEYNQVFIVTDGVFSMDGSIAPLQELCELARQFDAQVIVDEAHGTGVLGEHGRGASEHAHVEDQVLLRIGTMSKAMGGLGGFVATDATTADWLRNSARTQFFSTALPPAVCAAMCASLKLITDEPQRRQQLLRNTQFAHQTLQNLGLQTIGSGPAPIIAVLMPGDKAAVQVAAELQDQGWFVPAIRPPTVPQGSSRLRISLSSAHTQQQIANLGEAIVPLLSKC
jgi:8-amino-7-oxononanoate synthase